MSSPQFLKLHSTAVSEAFLPANNILEEQLELMPAKEVICVGETQEDQLRSIALNSGRVDDEYWLIGPLQKFDSEILDIEYILTDLKEELLKPLEKGNGYTTTAEMWEAQYINAEKRNIPISHFLVVGSTVIKLLGKENRSRILESANASAIDTEEFQAVLAKKPPDFDGWGISTSESWDEKVRLVVDAIYTEASPAEKENLYKTDYAVLKKNIKNQFNIEVRERGSDYTHLVFKQADLINKDTKGPLCLFSYANIRVEVIPSSVTKNADRLQIRIVCDDDEHPAQALIHKGTGITHTRKPQEKDYRAPLVYASNQMDGKICPSSALFPVHMDKFLSYWRSCSWLSSYYPDTLVYLIGNISNTHNNDPLYAKPGILLKLESSTTLELKAQFSAVWQKIMPLIPNLQGLMADICKTRVQGNVPGSLVSAVLGILGMLHLGMPKDRKTNRATEVEYTSLEKSPHARFLVSKKTYVHASLDVDNALKTIESLYASQRQLYEDNVPSLLQLFFYDYFDPEDYIGKGNSSLSKYKAINVQDFAKFQALLLSFLFSKDLFLQKVALVAAFVYALHGVESAEKIFIQQALKALGAGDNFIQGLLRKYLYIASLQAWETPLLKYCSENKWFLSFACTSKDYLHHIALKNASVEELEEVVLLLVQTSPHRVVTFLGKLLSDPQSISTGKKFVEIICPKLPIVLLKTHAEFFLSHLSELSLISLVDKYPILAPEAILAHKSVKFSAKNLLKLAKIAFELPEADKSAILQCFEMAEVKANKLWDDYTTNLLFPYLAELLESKDPVLVEHGKRLKNRVIDSTKSLERKDAELDELTVDYRLYLIECQLKQGNLIPGLRMLFRLSSITIPFSMQLRYESCLRAVVMEGASFRNIFILRLLLDLLRNLALKDQLQFVNLAWQTLRKDTIFSSKEKIQSDSQIHITMLCAEYALLWIKKCPQIPIKDITESFEHLQKIILAFNNSCFDCQLFADLFDAVLMHPPFENKSLKLQLSDSRKIEVLKKFIKNSSNLAASQVLRSIKPENFTEELSHLAFRLSRRWSNSSKPKVMLQLAHFWLTSEKLSSSVSFVIWMKCAVRWLAIASQQIQNKDIESFIVCVMKRIHSVKDNEKTQISVGMAVIISESMPYVSAKTLKETFFHEMFIPLMAALKEHLNLPRKTTAFLRYLHYVHVLHGNTVPLPVHLKTLKLEFEGETARVIFGSLEKVSNTLKQPAVDMTVPATISDFIEECPDYLRNPANIEFLHKVFSFLWHQNRKDQAFKILKLIVALCSSADFTVTSKFKRTLLESLILFRSSDLPQIESLIHLLRGWVGDQPLENSIQALYKESLDENSFENAIKFFEYKEDSDALKILLDRLLEAPHSIAMLSRLFIKYFTKISLTQWEKFWTYCKAKENPHIKSCVEVFDRTYPYIDKDHSNVEAHSRMLEVISVQQTSLFKNLVVTHPRVIELSFIETISKELRLALIMEGFKENFSAEQLFKLWKTFMSLTNDSKRIFEVSKSLFPKALENEYALLLEGIVDQFCSQLKARSEGPFKDCSLLLAFIKQWPTFFNLPLFKLIKGLNLVGQENANYQLPALKWLLGIDLPVYTYYDVFMLLKGTIHQPESLIFIRQTPEKILEVLREVSGNAKQCQVLDCLKISNRCLKDNALPHNETREFVVSLLDIIFAEGSENLQFTLEEKLSAVVCSCVNLQSYAKKLEQFVSKVIDNLLASVESKQGISAFSSRYATLFSVLQGTSLEPQFCRVVLRFLLAKLSDQKSNMDDRNTFIEIIINVLQFHGVKDNYTLQQTSKWYKLEIESFVLILFEIECGFDIKPILDFFKFIDKTEIYSKDELSVLTTAFELFFFKWHQSKPDLNNELLILALYYLVEASSRSCLKNVNQRVFKAFNNVIYDLQLYSDNSSELSSFYKNALDLMQTLDQVLLFIKHLTPPGYTLGSALRNEDCFSALEIHLLVFEKLMTWLSAASKTKPKDSKIYFNELSEYFHRVLSIKVNISDPSLDLSFLWRNYVQITQKYLDIVTFLHANDAQTIQPLLRNHFSQLCVLPIIYTISKFNGPKESREQLRYVFQKLLDLKCEDILEDELITLLFNQERFAEEPIFRSSLLAVHYFSSKHTLHIANAVVAFESQSSAIHKTLSTLNEIAEEALSFDNIVKTIEYVCHIAFKDISLSNLDLEASKAAGRLIQALLLPMSLSEKLVAYKAILLFFYNHKNHQVVFYNNALVLEMLEFFLTSVPRDKTILEILLELCFTSYTINFEGDSPNNQALLVETLNFFSGFAESLPHEKPFSYYLVHCLNHNWARCQYAQNRILLSLFPALNADEKQLQVEVGMQSVISERDSLNGIFFIVHFIQMDISISKNHVKAIFQILLSDYKSHKIQAKVFLTIFQSIFMELELEEEDKLFSALPMELCKDYESSLLNEDFTEISHNMRLKFQEHIVTKGLEDLRETKRSLAVPTIEMTLDYVDAINEYLEYFAEEKEEIGEEEEKNSKIENGLCLFLNEFIQWDHKADTLEIILNWFFSEAPPSILELMDSDSFCIILILITQKITSREGLNGEIESLIASILEKWQFPLDPIYLTQRDIVNSLQIMAHTFKQVGMNEEAFALYKCLQECLNSFDDYLTHDILTILVKDAADLFICLNTWTEFFNLMTYVQNTKSSLEPDESFFIFVDTLWSKVEAAKSSFGACLMGIIFSDIEPFAQSFKAKFYAKKYLEERQVEDAIPYVAKLIQAYVIDDEAIWRSIFKRGKIAKEEVNIEALKGLMVFADKLPLLSQNHALYCECLTITFSAASKAKYFLQWPFDSVKLGKQVLKFGVDDSQKKMLLYLILLNNTFNHNINEPILLQLFEIRKLLHDNKSPLAEGDLTDLDKFLVKQSVTQQALTAAFRLLNWMQLEKTNPDIIISWYSPMMLRLKDILSTGEALSPALSSSYRYLVGYLKKHLTLAKAISLTQNIIKIGLPEFADDVFIFITLVASNAKKEPITSDIQNNFYQLLLSAMSFRKLSFLKVMELANGSLLLSETSIINLQHESLRVDVGYGNANHWERGLKLAEKIDQSTTESFPLAQTLLQYLVKNFKHPKQTTEFRKASEKVIKTFGYHSKSTHYACEVAFPALIRDVCWVRSRSFALRALLLNELMSVEPETPEQRCIVLTEAQTLCEIIVSYYSQEDVAIGKLLSALLMTWLAQIDNLFEGHIDWFFQKIYHKLHVRNFNYEDTRFWSAVCIKKLKAHPTNLVIYSLDAFAKISHQLVSISNPKVVGYFLENLSLLVTSAKPSEKDLREVFLEPLLKVFIMWGGINSLVASALKTCGKVIYRLVDDENISPEVTKLIGEYMDNLIFAIQKKGFIQEYNKKSSLSILKLICKVLDNRYVFSSYNEDPIKYYTHLNAFIPIFIATLNVVPNLSMDYMDTLTKVIIKDFQENNEAQLSFRADTLKNWVILLNNNPQGKKMAKSCLLVSKLFVCLKNQYAILNEISAKLVNSSQDRISEGQ